MNARPVNVFLLTSRLQNISITEIVWGAMAVAGYAWGASKSSLSGWNIFHAVAAALLSGTGILGVLTIQRLRRNTADSRSFRILGACNSVLCFLDGISVLLLIVLILMLVYWVDTARQILGITTLPVNNTGYNGDDAESRRHSAEDLVAPGLGTVNVAVCVVMLIVAGVHVGITAVAAFFSFRISTGLSHPAGQQVPIVPHSGMSTLPPSGVPLLSRPGYGSYPVAPVMSPPIYTADPPLKQNLGY